jgi:aspartate 1-decarboxylase
VRRRMMKSKIHRATVSDANLHYVGSITLDTELMALADIREWEQVSVVDIDNGNRFETYVINGGPGDVCLNGAAARLVHPGDRIIVITYADFEDAELDAYQPRIVHVDTANRPIDERAAQALAKSAVPGPVRYTEIDAQVDREMAWLDEELELGGL